MRLLRLQPGIGNQQLSCTLEIVDDFLSAPPYHAHSYCWGDETDVVGLRCNGKRMQITRNLDAALHRLRESYHVLLIWADAISINRDDIAERNQQVSVMDQISSIASQVYIWLGPSDANTQPAMTMI